MWDTVGQFLFMWPNDRRFNKFNWFVLLQRKFAEIYIRG